MANKGRGDCTSRVRCRGSYDDCRQNTQLQNELTATAAGTLCSATPGSFSNGSTWFDSTTTFTLNLEALEQLKLTAGTTKTLLTITLTSAANASTTHTLSLSASTSATSGEGTADVLKLYLDNSEKTCDLLTPTVSGTYSIVSGTGMTHATTKENTFVYDSVSSTYTALHSNGGIGGTVNQNDLYVSSVKVDKDYVTAFSVTNATLTNNAAGIGAAAANIPEPATATLSLLALAGLAARRRRK